MEATEPKWLKALGDENARGFLADAGNPILA
jgi:hypothetical protein